MDRVTEIYINDESIKIINEMLFVIQIMLDTMTVEEVKQNLSELQYSLSVATEEVAH